MLVNFKAALAVRQIKQIDLALKLKIDPTFLSQVINQRRGADPSLRARLATALQADEAWLFKTVSNIPRRTTCLEPAPVGMSRAARRG